MRQQNQKLTHVKHEFDPIFDENSEILILGTLPSVKSREQNFYYGHPQNRFWKVIAALFEEPVPGKIREKGFAVKTSYCAVGCDRRVRYCRFFRQFHQKCCAGGAVCDP